MADVAKWPITDDIAKVLKERMEEKGLTTADVAKACKLKQDVQIRRMMRIGQVRPMKSSGYLSAVCAYLELGQMDFLPLDKGQLRLLKALERLRLADVDEAALLEEFDERVDAKVNKAVGARGDVKMPRNPPAPGNIKSRSSSD